ncbi:hypothetical protein AX15_001288 [Amanita polypyramis BW_CC]|nr:hypothetical protein AX15_001288 [Amanita polypyramis BW_CC]
MLFPYMDDTDDSQKKRAIRLAVPRRFYLVPGAALTVGVAIGLVRGGRTASLRFLAENVHRPPTTVQGCDARGAEGGGGGRWAAGTGGTWMGGDGGGIGANGMELWEGGRSSGGNRVHICSDVQSGVEGGATDGDAGGGCGGSGEGAWVGAGAAGGPYRKRVKLSSTVELWPSTPSDQLTPKPPASPRREQNPFDVQPAPLTPTTTHPLLNTRSSPSPFVPSASASLNGGSGLTDLTPLAAAFPVAVPTTQLSLHAPEFKMQQPPPGPRKQLPSTSSMSLSSSSASASQASSSAPTTSTSKGQIHVKLIQARGLNARSVHARPYAVVQFEQNEFISRDPIDETGKEVKGVATTLSRIHSSNAVAALGAVESKAIAADGARRVKSANASPSSSVSSSKSSGIANGFFGRLSPHNPVWKHEVSFDVTSEDSLIIFTVYDRSVSDLGFLGTVQIKPLLIHDHTVDQWYKLSSLEDESITGEMRVQITFEQYKVKRALTPRDFEFLKLIGRGTFGKVFQVRKKDTKRIYAMKVLSKREIVAKKEVAHTIGERKILQRSLESPFLVGLKFSFQTDTDLYLVTDFKSGGELFWHLQRETRFGEERARFYVAELILALEHLHKYNIVYRDLKPENILLDATGHVALCDFGLSKADLRPDELTTTFCGTTEYLAPEILLDEHGYSKIVDFWSLGVLLFEMCCGWSPFYAEDTQQMYKNICFGKIRFPKGVICEEGKQFVKGLLNRNPKHRLGAQRDAEELKEHPFFKIIDWKALAQKQVTPPFKPVVESDESTNNFDPEFTTADIEPDIANMDLDEEDPSEDWLSQSIGTSSGLIHTPNGPLGSERRASKTNGSMGNLNVSSGTTNGRGIQIKRKKRKDVAGSLLTRSVQEKFKGFTFSGGDSIMPPSNLQAKKKADEENAVDDEEVPEVTTEDEFEDTARSAGRYANLRRKGFGFSTLDDY